jgi:hypothetical protein
MWTVEILRSRDINKYVLGDAKIPLGIVVHAGPGFGLLWAATLSTLFVPLFYAVPLCMPLHDPYNAQFK